MEPPALLPESVDPHARPRDQYTRLQARFHLPVRCNAFFSYAFQENSDLIRGGYQTTGVAGSTFLIDRTPPPTYRNHENRVSAFANTHGSTNLATFGYLYDTRGPDHPSGERPVPSRQALAQPIR